MKVLNLYRHKLKRLLRSTELNLSIFVLVIISLILILVEIFAPIEKVYKDYLLSINDFITFVLIIELVLRWFVSKSFRVFLKNHWLDILAVLPLLRVFRVGSLSYLLRFLRILSLGALLRKRLRSLAVGLKTRFIEYGLLIGFMLFALIFGAIGLAEFEVGVDENLKEPVEAFWKALFSLLSGEYAEYPASFGGKITLLVLLFFELSFFAFITGTVSAVMIEKIRESGMNKVDNCSDLNDHIVLCGFSTKVATILDEFSKDTEFCDREVVLVSQHATAENLQEIAAPMDNLLVIQEDYTNVDVLTRSGVKSARLAMIIAEDFEGRNTHDIDARTILAALTIEKIERNVHTCAEIHHEEYTDHLKMGGVNDVLIREKMTARLMARVGLNKGLMNFFEDVLIGVDGNTLDFINVPQNLVGQSFEVLLSTMSGSNQGIALGIKPPNGELLINPLGVLVNHSDQVLILRNFHH